MEDVHLNLLLAVSHPAFAWEHLKSWGWRLLRLCCLWPLIFFPPDGNEWRAMKVKKPCRIEAVRGLLGEI